MKTGSICSAKTRGKRVPDEEDMCGWDVKNDRRVGYVVGIKDGRLRIHLFQTEHGPPTDPPQYVEKEIEEVYRTCSQPSLSTATHGRCYYHQGGPSGPRNGNFKHGAYSRHLPTRIAADFEAIVKDKELAELDYDIALVQTRIIDLIGRVEHGESGELWNELHQAAAAFQASIKEGDAPEVKKAVEKIYNLTLRGKGDIEIWQEVVQMVDVKRRLVDSNARLAEKRGRQMTTERAYTLLAYVDSGLKKAVAANVDEDTAERIMETFAQYMRAIYHGTASHVIDA